MNPLRIPLVVTLIGLASLGPGCPDDPKPNDVSDISPPSEIIEDAPSGDATGPGETSPGGCTSDAQCIASTDCKRAACVAGECQETDQPDGTACANPDPLCNSAAVCLAGTCDVAPAPPQCDGVACGTDPCGNPCGSCPPGQQCVAGTCEADPAGCGGISFEGCCTADNILQWCENDQLNTLDCTNESRTPAVCSWWGENSFFGCLGELEATPADIPYLCPGETCDKTCDDPGIECGSVCGQLCGVCGEGETCRPDNTCGLDACAAGIGSEGCCDGATVVWCEGGESQSITCQDSCGWDAPNGFYDCGETEAEPTGAFPITCGFTSPGPESSEQVEPVEVVPDAGGSETLTSDDVIGPDSDGPNDTAVGDGSGDAPLQDDSGTGDAPQTNDGTAPDEGGASDAATDGATPSDAGASDAAPDGATPSDAGAGDAAAD